MTLTEKQYNILDQLYFTCTFDALLELLPLSSEDLKSELIPLLRDNLVHQMLFDDVSKDFVMQELANFNAMTTSAYVISKKGLLIHNSR